MHAFDRFLGRRGGPTPTAESVAKLPQKPGTVPTEAARPVGAPPVPMSPDLEAARPPVGIEAKPTPPDMPKPFTAAEAVPDAQKPGGILGLTQEDVAQLNREGTAAKAGDDEEIAGVTPFSFEEPALPDTAGAKTEPAGDDEDVDGLKPFSFGDDEATPKDEPDNTNAGEPTDDKNDEEAGTTAPSVDRVRRLTASEHSLTPFSLNRVTRLTTAEERGRDEDLAWSFDQQLDVVQTILKKQEGDLTAMDAVVEKIRTEVKDPTIHALIEAGILKPNLPEITPANVYEKLSPLLTILPRETLEKLTAQQASRRNNTDLASKMPEGGNQQPPKTDASDTRTGVEKAYDAIAARDQTPITLGAPSISNLNPPADQKQAA